MCIAGVARPELPRAVRYRRAVACCVSQRGALVDHEAAVQVCLCVSVSLASCMSKFHASNLSSFQGIPHPSHRPHLQALPPQRHSQTPSQKSALCGRRSCAVARLRSSKSSPIVSPPTLPAPHAHVCYECKGIVTRAPGTATRLHPYPFCTQTSTSLLSSAFFAANTTRPSVCSSRSAGAQTSAPLHHSPLASMYEPFSQVGLDAKARRVEHCSQAAMVCYECWIPVLF
jgi:hypothetical protein